MSSIFTSIEFYITALAVAVAIIAFFGSSDDTTPAASYIYSPTIITLPGHASEQPSVTFKALENGSIEVTRYGLRLPEGYSIYINAEFVKDRITLTEKITYDRHASNHADVSCRLHFDMRPRSGKKYFIRYECPKDSLWGTMQFANLEGYSGTMQLKS